MKYIRIPADVAVTTRVGDIDTSESPNRLSFRDFLMGRLSDPAFATSMAMVEAGEAIASAFAKSNGVLALEPDHYALLRAVTETPHSGYHPLVAHNLLPFMRAIRDATDGKPNEVH